MSKKRNPIQDAKDQQASLNLAIKQNEGNPEIQESLRLQKYKLDAFITKYIQTHPQNDGGNVTASSSVNAGDKSSTVQ